MLQLIRIERIDRQEVKQRDTMLLGALSGLVSLSVGVRVISTAMLEKFGTHSHSFCPLLNLTGIPCPFCGLTRSLFSLLQGDLARAFWYHPFGPLMWGGGAVFALVSLSLLCFQRTISVKFPQSVMLISITVTALVLWVGNILYGHH